jgi:Xaa-Pro aminopeptidase
MINARAKNIGIEADHMSVASRSALGRMLGKSIRLRETTGLVEGLRLIKEPEEINRIRAAVNLGSNLLDPALKHIKAGVPEMSVAAEIEYAARKGGAEAMSFETIVTAGARTAMPHGRASEAAIPRNGFVLMDFGVILGGYCSDMTRTVYVGKAPRELRGMYEAVREAQLAAIAAVKPGASVDAVDRAARRTLQKTGLARYFTHSTGHGVGLEIHESPRVARQGTDVLRPGMVITVEPGVYIPGKGGVRIEDMVLVTGGGHDVLTNASKDFISL